MTNDPHEQPLTTYQLRLATHELPLTTPPAKSHSSFANDELTTRGYSPGVKANVAFFTKGAKSEQTWIYDARTNGPGITKKDRPLTPAHFADFDKCYGADPDGRARPSRPTRRKIAGARSPSQR